MLRRALRVCCGRSVLASARGTYGPRAPRALAIELADGLTYRSLVALAARLGDVRPGSTRSPVICP
jgi:hypothetical protein